MFLGKTQLKSTNYLVNRLFITTCQPSNFLFVFILYKLFHSYYIYNIFFFVINLHGIDGLVAIVEGEVLDLGSVDLGIFVLQILFRNVLDVLFIHHD